MVLPQKQDDDVDKADICAVDTSFVPSSDDMISVISDDQDQANTAIHRIIEESNFAYSKAGKKDVSSQNDYNNQPIYNTDQTDYADYASEDYQDDSEDDYQ
jgi:hypothetical protein